MKLLDFFRKRTNPRNPNEFVKKFIEDSNTERAQLEMIYGGTIILQVDPLKFVPSWFKVADKSKKDYANGYVLFFVKNKDEFNSSETERKFNRLKGNHFLKIDEFYGDEPVVSIARFIPATDDYLNLAIEMKGFVDKFYSFKEENPSILFNIRYLDGFEG